MSFHPTDSSNHAFAQPFSQHRQHEQHEYQPAARRSPWQLKAAGIAWVFAGVLFALGPFLAAVLLNLQYSSLRSEALRLIGLVDGADRSDLLQIERYITEFERIEAWFFESAGVVFLPLIVGYIAMAAPALVCYLVFGLGTARGANWARITATVLACVSFPLIASVWIFVAAFSWIPLNALWANHIGLALIALHAIGVVFAWLPASNTFVRRRALPVSTTV